MTVLPGSPEDAAKASKSGRILPNVTGQISGDSSTSRVPGSAVPNGTGPSPTSASHLEQNSVPMVMTGATRQDSLESDLSYPLFIFFLFFFLFLS